MNNTMFGTINTTEGGLALTSVILTVIAVLALIEGWSSRERSWMIIGSVILTFAIGFVALSVLTMLTVIPP